MNLYDAAKRYAAADNSDPFAYRRACTQLRNGIAQYATKDGDKGYFDAEEYTETQSLVLPSGKRMEWQVTAYRNVCRP